MRIMFVSALGIAVYIALAYARMFSGGCCGATEPEGLEGVFVAAVEGLIAVITVSLGAQLFHHRMERKP